MEANARETPAPTATLDPPPPTVPAAGAEALHRTRTGDPFLTMDGQAPVPARSGPVGARNARHAGPNGATPAQPTPAKRPRSSAEAKLHAEADALAADLGYDADALATLTARVGGIGPAVRSLRRRVQARQAGIARRHERDRVEAEAERRADADRDRRRENAEHRRDARRRASLGQRLDCALRGLDLASTVPASSTHVGSRKHPESAPPPAVAMPEVDHRLASITWHLEQLEAELDALHGHASPVLLTGEAKDAVIIARFAGVDSRELAASCPELGGHRTIERAREAAGYTGRLGRPRRKA